MATADKAALMATIRIKLEAELSTLEEAARTTREGLVHEESRAENDKDTRGIEASYLARGQAERVEQMQETLARLRFLSLAAYGPDDPIGAGALVDVEIDEEAQSTFFLVPVGGGVAVDFGEREVKLITAISPVGKAMLGKLEGEDFEIRVRGAVREYVITSVR